MTTRDAVRYLRKRLVLAGDKTVFLPTKPGWKAGPETQAVIDLLVGRGYKTR